MRHPARSCTTRRSPPQPGQGELTAPDPANYQYLTTRDGTKLAIDVHTPGGPGPWPTLIEYSGYGYATPYGPPQSGLGSYLPLLGYAVVDVNMRGTGCSGGAYTYFERLQSLDGYDVVETIAHQPWVLGHKVGMLGISYGGISQLFTAATDPPALEAIAPLSVFDSTQTTLYPGGILNTGFALTWGEQRVQDALPASPTGGQAWAYQRIRAGDQTCRRNQALHGEATNLVAEIHRNAHIVPAVADPLDPITFVHKIKAPAFVVCQFTDEQTGGHCPDLAAADDRDATQVVHVHQRRPHRLVGPGHADAADRLLRPVRRARRAAGALAGAAFGDRQRPVSDRDGHLRDHAAA